MEVVFVVGLLLGTIIGVALGLFGASVSSRTSKTRSYWKHKEGLVWALLLTQVAPVPFFVLPWTI